MLLLQTLIGAWGSENLRDRLAQYMIKSAKEAKVNTSWIQEDPRWEDALRAYVEELFALPPRHPLWKGLLPFADRVAQVGMHNSLAQLALKLAAPGVPDFYQGTELWDLSLVDPDNRRPVDFALRRRLLDEIRQSSLTRAEIARELYAGWHDGRIKLFVMHAGLQARKQEPQLFGEGAYRALDAEGPRAANVCAFMRLHGGKAAMVVAPRMVAGLLDGARLPPAAFSGTRVPLPEGKIWIDAITGEERRSGAVDELFATLPVALLISR